MRSFDKDDQIEFLQMAARTIEKNAEAIINKGLTAGVRRYSISIDLDSLDDNPGLPEISVSYDMLPNTELINEWVEHNLKRQEILKMEGNNVHSD